MCNNLGKADLLTRVDEYQFPVKCKAYACHSSFAFSDTHKTPKKKNHT